MARKPLDSSQILAVLRVFMQDTEKSHHGYDIAKKVERASGPVYRTLNRLEAEGLLISEWDKDWAGGPRRKFYAPTYKGIKFYETRMASLGYQVLKAQK
jgi:DNA-binding PadR family transcriptional regulator